MRKHTIGTPQGIEPDNKPYRRVIVVDDQSSIKKIVDSLPDAHKCDCSAQKDLSQGKGPDRHIYCPRCGKHVYKGIHWTRKHWEWWIETTNLTKEQAIEVMQAGHRVAHRYFDKDEWVTMRGNKIVHENGAEMWADEFWKIRDGGLAWNDDWTIVS